MGVRPHKFAMFVRAPCKRRNFTIRVCPCLAAMCKGVFLNFCDCSFADWPSLIRILTKSSSPSLQALHISKNSWKNTYNTYNKKPSLLYRPSRYATVIYLRNSSCPLEHHCQLRISPTCLQQRHVRCMMRNARGSTVCGPEHKCWHHSTRGGPSNRNFLSYMRDAVVCTKDHLSIPGPLSTLREARSTQRDRWEQPSVREFCSGCWKRLF